MIVYWTTATASWPPLRPRQPQGARAWGVLLVYGAERVGGGAGAAVTVSREVALLGGGVHLT